MIRSFTAFTNEVDDTEAAVSEIQTQLDAFGPLGRSTVALVNAYPEFIESGAYEAIARALPFPVVGCTTLGAVDPATEILECLSFHILTSDDVYFQPGLTEPIPGEAEAPILEGYARAVFEAENAGIANANKPALILSYLPLLMNAGGDFLVQAIDKASGGVLNFGTTAVDDTTDYLNSRVLFNEGIYADRYAFVLVYGEVNPRFYVATIPPDRILANTGVVTAVSGNQIQAINNRPVSEFLMDLGLTKDENDVIVGMNSYPFIVDLGDGRPPVVRIIFAITPEGYAVCGGDIPVGATLSVGNIDKPSVLYATGEKLDELLADGAPGALISFSCIGRLYAMEFEPLKEAHLVRDKFAPTRTPFTLAYSGGEVCPLKTAGETNYANRFHNDTFIACAI
ncbi:MAG: FIST C-terminal domain-containing protein [Clostridiales Family XIII bacterium]|jgi:hypothetical protein|nr:FIST C-terminal domain-containing protein [Clostridiales Family XIII bacterium]